MSRLLSEYLPIVVRGYDVYQAITAAQQPEIDRLWACVDDVRENQYLSTAGELGLSRWEKILNIVPKGTDSIKERRFRIFARINEELPYTLPQLRRMLETICGVGEFTAELQENSYILIVRVGLAAKNNYDDVKSLLEMSIMFGDC